MSWLARLPRSTDAWSCPWFLLIVVLSTVAVVVFCYEDMAVPAAASAWLLGYVVGARR